MKRNLYFIPRNTWFYTTFSHVSVYVRYAITAGLMCFLVVIWLATSYRIFSKMQADYLISMHAAQEQKNMLEYTQKNIRQLRPIIEQKKHNLQQLAASTVVKDYIEKLLHMMQEHNLTLQSYTPQQTRIKKWYTKFTTRIDCSGSYENVLLFIQHITHSALPILCSYLHIEKQQEGILASCHISWYDFSKGEHEKSK